MDRQDGHLSDEALLSVADGELSKRRAARARSHLASCWECRVRMADIENTIADFVRARREAIEPDLPPAAGSRALLKAQLSELKSTSRRNAWSYVHPFMTNRVLAYSLAALVLIAAGVPFVQKRRESSAEVFVSAAVHAASLPNPNLTPGFARPVTLVQLCSTDRVEVEKPVSAALRRQVFKEYGMDGAAPADYEIDYLISPGLGGADDIRNLWPEPRFDTEWNSYVKDRLEEQLHEMVCGGKLSLVTAQREIARDWIAAYKRYFHTDQVIPGYSSRYEEAGGNLDYLRHNPYGLPGRPRLAPYARSSSRQVI